MHYSCPWGDEILQDLGSPGASEGAGPEKPRPGLIRSPAREEGGQARGSCVGRLPEEIAGTGRPPSWTDGKVGVPQLLGGRGWQQVPQRQQEPPPTEGMHRVGKLREHLSHTSKESPKARKRRRNPRRGLLAKEPSGDSWSRLPKGSVSRKVEVPPCQHGGHGTNLV